MKQLAFLVAGMFAAMLTLTLPVAPLDEFVGRLLPNGGANLQLENTAKGLFQTMHFLAYIPFAFIWGALSDRSGKRKPFLLVGMLGQAVMFGLMPLIDNLWLLYAARFIEGTFSIAVVSMLMTMTLDIAPPGRRGMTLGIFTMGMLLGNGLGAPIGGALSELSLAYPFWLGSALLVLTLAVIAVGVRETSGVTHGYSFRRSMMVFREHPRLGIPYAFTMLDRLTVGFFVGQFPILADQVYGFSPRERGFYLMAFLFCFALFSPVGGLISDRFGRARPMLLGTVAYGLMLMLVGRVGPELLYAVMSFGGLCGAILYPPSIALVGDYAGAGQRAVAMGGFNLAGSIGFAAGPLLFSLIADGLGILTPPLVAGVLCLLAAAVAAPLLLKRET
ncbi:MAG: MFS transporter [Chloroflexota bacterium]|nr:MFS transporter [Chloroflexota bacterium]